MPEQLDLKENTRLLNRYFPLNVFLNSPNSHNILHAHWHDNIEIIYMVEGSAVFHAGSEAYPAEPGEIVFVNRGLLHSGYSIHNTRVNYYAIVFHPSLLASQAPDPVHTQFITPLVDGHASFPGKISRSNPVYPFLHSAITGLIEEFKRKDPAFEIAVKAYLHLLVTHIIRAYPETQRVSPPTNALEKNMDKFKTLFSFIEGHYPEKITIAHASRMVNMSPFHFCKTFKKITGRTFIEFVNLYRVNEAESLLRSSEYSVSEVAEKVGFCNINYFDKVFKEFKRYSPSKCRK